MTKYTPYTKEQAIEKFWSRVDKSHGDDNCWLWVAADDGHRGYGKMRWHGRQVNAHRISWELANGPIPDGLQVLHNCPDGDNPACVNPAHLWLGSNADNVADRDKKGRGNQPSGEQNGRCKLSDLQVAEIRLRYAAGGTSHQKLADEFGVTVSHIGYIVRRKSRA